MIPTWGVSGLCNLAIAKRGARVTQAVAVGMGVVDQGVVGVEVVAAAAVAATLAVAVVVTAILEKVV